MIPTILEYSDNTSSVCSFWRSRGVLSELSREGHINIIEGTWNDEWPTVRFARIAFFQRPMNKDCFNQVAMCRDLGLKIWLDFDDSPIIPPSHEVYNLWCETFDMKWFIKICSLAHIVTTSTEYLKNYYLQFCNNVIVIPNALNDHWLTFKKPSNNKIVLWRGGTHHLTDLFYYKDEVCEVMNEHPDWKFQVIGSEAKFIKDRIPNYVYAGSWDIHKYFAYILTHQPSIFVVPLVNDDLNRGKSDISWQEATLCGATALTPHWWHLTGKSATYKDKKTFKQNLEKLIKDQDFRLSLYNASIKKIKSDLVLSKVNKKRLQIINNL